MAFGTDTRFIFVTCIRGLGNFAVKDIILSLKKLDLIEKSDI
jgi:hypothetical protein